MTRRSRGNKWITMRSLIILSNPIQSSGLLTCKLANWGRAHVAGSQPRSDALDVAANHVGVSSTKALAPPPPPPSQQQQQQQRVAAEALPSHELQHAARDHARAVSTSMSPPPPPPPPSAPAQALPAGAIAAAAAMVASARAAQQAEAVRSAPTELIGEKIH